MEKFTLFEVPENLRPLPDPEDDSADLGHGVDDDGASDEGTHAPARVVINQNPMVATAIPDLGSPLDAPQARGVSGVENDVPVAQADPSDDDDDFGLAPPPPIELHASAYAAGPVAMEHGATLVAAQPVVLKPVTERRAAPVEAPSARASVEPIRAIEPPVRKPRTRAELLASRAVRPKSALEAARDAATRETRPNRRDDAPPERRPKPRAAARPAVVKESAPTVSAQPSVPTQPGVPAKPTLAKTAPAKPVPAKTTTPAKPPASVTDLVAAAIAADLGGGAKVFVLDVQVVAERQVPRALWRGHRAKFLADGNLERAASASAVLHAIESVRELALARVVAKGKDYLAVVDLASRRVVACLADAHALAALDLPRISSAS